MVKEYRGRRNKIQIKSERVRVRVRDEEEWEIYKCHDGKEGKKKKKGNN